MPSNKEGQLSDIALERSGDDGKVNSRDSLESYKNRLEQSMGALDHEVCDSNENSMVRNEMEDMGNNVSDLVMDNSISDDDDHDDIYRHEPKDGPTNVTSRQMQPV